MEILHFLRATFPRECGKWKFLTNATFLRTEAPLIQTRQTVKQKRNKQKTVKCLPNLRETLIEVQTFHSICLKIEVKVRRSSL